MRFALFLNTNYHEFPTNYFMNLFSKQGFVGEYALS